MSPHDIVFVATLVVASLVELILYFAVDEGSERRFSARTQSPSSLAGRGVR